MDPSPRPRPALEDGYPLAGLMRDVLGRGKPFRFEARGSSMYPAVRDGDVVTVAPLADDGPRTGDVVAFVHAATGGVRLHRVVGTAAGRYLVKGDNALASDGALDREALLGLVVGVERGGRALRIAPPLLAAATARLSRCPGFTRLVRRVRRAVGAGEGRA
ncbi:MAG: S24/S26 family peptidase [Candidatus Aminicenantes bacterium]|jgi:hypothetical protein|nr:S24/S26 family peptidase [Candidatus Aminicenantes bacterium]NLH76549.1 hypothetical protein [Acidobacteriota bacterium]